MAATTVFTGSKVASFQGTELHKYLKGTRDSRPYRRAEHEFPKRDGARQERMGRRAFSTVWTLAYIGETAIADLKKLAAALDKDSTGSLVHPIWGQMRAFCDGIDPAIWDPSQAVDAIEFTLTFHEDQLDAKTATANSTQGAAAKAQKTQAASDDYTAVITELATTLGPAVMADVNSFTASAATAASSYATAAAASVLNTTPDNSLDNQLATIGVGVRSSELAVDAAIAQVIAAIPPGLPTPGRAAVTYNSLAAGEVMYASALELQEAIIANRPARIDYIVPGPISLLALAAQLYGGPDAMARVDEILSLNRIANPAALSTGMILKLTTPTVIQP